MEYYLMHQHIRVAAIDLIDESGDILAVREVYCAEHFPIGVAPTLLSFRDWWNTRGIPASRSGLRDALERLRVPNPELLILKCNGLSLSDQYWITPCAAPQNWHDVNFFENDFSDDVGEALFGMAPKTQSAIYLSSPCNTSDGYLQKRWKIAQGERVLMKAGTAPYFQEPLNEAVATVFCKRLQIPHIPYYVIWENSKPYSVCKDFVDKNTELVSARRILDAVPKKGKESSLAHFLRSCSELGIPKVHPQLEQMITLDYLLGNTDRHLNNFGALRNAKTLAWLGLAPVFDTGSCMCYDAQESNIFMHADMEAKPFAKTQDEQLRLICSSFDWLDPAALTGIAEECREIYKSSPLISEYRRSLLCELLQARVERLQKRVRTLHRQRIRQREEKDLGR